MAGTFKEVVNVWENVAGTWKEKVVPKLNVAGTWKECMSYGYAYTLSKLSEFEYSGARDEPNGATAKIDDTHILMADSSTSSTGRLWIMDISTAYAITEGEYLVGNDYEHFHNLLKISDTKFLHIYDNHGDGGIDIVDIDLTSATEITVTASGTTFGNGGIENTVIAGMLDSTHFYICYGDHDRDGTNSIETYSISGNTVTLIDTLDLVADPVKAFGCLLTDSRFALEYEDAGDHFIDIYDFDASYNITLTKSNDVPGTDYESIARLDDTHILATRQSGYYCYHDVYTIDATTGIATKAQLSSEEMYQNNPRILLLADKHYLIVYKGDDGDAFADIFEINATYTSETRLARLEFNTDYGTDFSNITMLDENHFLLSYETEYGDNTGEVVCLKII